MKPSLENLTKQQLEELVEIYARNIYALDGVWFQSIEGTDGMDKAMHHDRKAWQRFTATEATRIKKFLKLPEYPGLNGLEKALSIRFSALANPKVELYREKDALIYRIVECRVQSARTKKGMELHPCASVGIIEHEGFASVIDERIRTEMVSCHPEVTDPGCACCWRFTMEP